MHSRKSNSLAGALKLSASALAAAIAIAVPVAGNAQTANTNVNVSARVQGQCQFLSTGHTMGFGTVNVLADAGYETANVDLRIQCNRGMKVSLSAGDGNYAAGTQKRMVHSIDNTQFLAYTIKAPTGAAFDTCSAPGTGTSLDSSGTKVTLDSLWVSTGGPNTVRLCGEMSANQKTAIAGDYSDVVAVTLTYE